jgi:thioredoxin reductase (NADPH)
MNAAYDLVIIGAGPAGLTAAIYAARYRLNTLVVSSDVGGLVLETCNVENYPGFKSVSGIDLANKFKEQVEALGVKIVESEITRIAADGSFKLFDKQKNSFTAKALILATGTRRRKLNVSGEEKFLGKGVSYCAVCDAPLFRGKIVGVVGGNDSAAVSALLLAEHAKKVYIIYRKEKIRAEPINIEKVESNSKIEIINNANVTEIKGSNFVESVVLDNGKEIGLDGVFIEIGTVPSLLLTHMLGVKTNEQGYIVVDNEQRTNIAGVFAAGDVTNQSLKQIITAAAQGAIAATSAYKYFRGVKK